MGNGRQTILDRLRKTFRIDYDDDCLDKWEGIELVTKSLDQQTESRIGMLLVNALLVFCITAGGMGIVLSAIDSDYQTWIVELVTLVASLYVAFCITVNGGKCRIYIIIGRCIRRWFWDAKLCEQRIL